MRSLRARLALILAVQLGVLGLLASGALGTGQSSSRVASTPQLAALSAAAHDTSPPLDQAPPVPNDPNRVIPELERTVAANVSPSVRDAAAQTRIASSPSVGSPLQTFDGITRLGIGSLYYPPDTVGDVGPAQYVEAVNGGIDVFSKTGTSLTGGVTDSAFWSGLAGCSGVSLTDPTVNYDQFADRWVYGELAYTLGGGSTWSGPFTECIAVSTTGDATGSWNRYAFNIDAPRYRWLPDYPKLGVWPDGYYLSFNDFDSTTQGFVGAGAMVVDRTSMLAGNSAQAVFFDLRSVAGLDGGMLPSDADGATPPPVGAPDYFVTPVDNSSNDQLGVWGFHVDWSNPAASSFTNVQALPVSAFDGNGYSVPQPGTTTTLDGLADDRLMNRLQYRNFGTYETLVTNETVDSGSSSDAPRWYELRRTGGAWAVNQQSTFMPDTVNRWMGSAAMNGSGDMALAYSAGDASTFAGLRYTGRQSSDSLSQMQAEQVLIAGGGAETAVSRWGDYSQLSVDPLDDCTFWYVGEYFNGTSQSDWSTRIGSFRVSSCTSTVSYTAIPTISGTVREGNSLTATAGTWSAVPTSTTYQWRRCDTSGIACSDIASATLNAYTLQAADAGKRIRVKVSVTTASGNGSAVSAATVAVVPSAPVSLTSPTVTGTAQVGYTLTAGTGTWTSATTPSYAYQWQSCNGGSCSNIPGATSANYVIGAGYYNTAIRVGVSASNAGGTTGPAYSSQTAAITYPPAPVDVVLPSISGNARQGQTLTASTGSWSGAVPIAYGYQWQRCDAGGSSCSPVSGQTAATYGITSSDVGSALRVTVTATNAGGVTAQDSLATAVVVPLAPVNTAVPTLSGSATVGSALTTSTGTWTSLTGYGVTYAYQWQRCGATCADIQGATSSRYDVTSSDAGTGLRAAVTATNAGGSTVAYTAITSVAASSGSGSGSGSGGSSSGGTSSGGSYSGGGSSPNLAVTGLATPTNPLPGDTVAFAITVTDKNLLAATRLLLTATLPTGMTYVSGSADRGNGCVQSSTDATKVTCNLDYLSADSPSARVLLYAKVAATGPLTFSVTAISQELGDSDTSDNVFTIALNSAATSSSGSPRGINGDGTTSTAKTDKKAPTAQALSSTGARASTAKLRFRIYDDSGVAKAVATVKRDGSVVGTAKTGFGPVAYGSVYYVGWQVPRAAPKGRYTFCVTAFDRAAHRSTSTCAPLALR